MRKRSRAEADEDLNLDSGASIKTRKRKDPVKWKYVALVGGMVAILLIFIGVNIFGNMKISVVMASHDLQSGTVIDIDRDLMPYKMSKADYASLNSISSKSGGDASPLVLASEVNKLKGKYVSNFTPKYSTFRRSFITTESLSVNPYLTDVPKDGKKYEIYSMAFDPSDMCTSMLLPGATIRVRGVLNVKNEYVDEVRALVAAKQVAIDSGDPIPNEGQSIIRTYAPTAAGSSGINTALSQDTPVAEVIMDIKVGDMENNNGESVLQILNALGNLPLEDRVKLLRTSVSENESANAFAKRIQPKKLVFMIDSETANTLSEFENLGSMKFKYTILAENVDDSMYVKLRSVTEDIYNYKENGVTD